MGEQLRSVGLDVGTTTTQLIVSELTVENRASCFAVPDMTIAQRRILYQSPIYFTPLASGQRVDGEAIRRIVTEEYARAGITRDSVDTGAVIITGETSRKENAQAVLASLSDFAGEFVVATAGPDLESLLAAKGAGAVDYSRDTGRRVLHMDIGGGTSNLALIEDGTVIQTGCLNVGGRLVKLEDGGRIGYLSPVLSGLTQWQVGDMVTEAGLSALADTLTQALEMAAGLRPISPLLDRLTTRETGSPWKIPEGDAPVISFSGGVADCIQRRHPPFAFGDMGPALGQAIGRSRLCRGACRLGEQTIRATVIGAGCHSAQLSGSTVYHQNITFPLKNLPVAAISAGEQTLPDLPERIRERLVSQDGRAVLALPGFAAADYAQVRALASAILESVPPEGVYLALEQDMAKALGSCLALGLPPDTPILCLDGLRLEPGSYLDVGTPIGPALPVVIKTLILSH